VAEKEDTDSLIRRIEKLLRLAESPNPNEAAFAREKAYKLMQDHGLSLDTFGKSTAEFEERVWRKFPGRIKKQIGWLAALVAEANGCVLVARPKHDETHNAWVLVGRPDTVACASAQLDYLFETMEAMAKRASDGRGLGWMNDYRTGWISAINAKLEAAKAEANPIPEQEAPQPVDEADERGLALRENQVQDYIEEEQIPMAKSNIYDMKTERERNMDALVAGARDGATVSLVRQVQAEAAPEPAKPKQTPGSPFHRTMDLIPKPTGSPSAQTPKPEIPTAPAQPLSPFRRARDAFEKFLRG
jgi:hypothetical protein